MTGHALQTAGQQVVFEAAAAIFISGGRRGKITKGEPVKTKTEIILYKETKDERGVKTVK